VALVGDYRLLLLAALLFGAAMCEVSIPRRWLLKLWPQGVEAGYAVDKDRRRHVLRLTAWPRAVVAGCVAGRSGAVSVVLQPAAACVWRTLICWASRGSAFDGCRFAVTILGLGGVRSRCPRAFSGALVGLCLCRRAGAGQRGAAWDLGGRRVVIRGLQALLAARCSNA